MEEEPIRDFIQDFAASFPQGVTQVVGDIIADVSEARGFLVLPEKENPPAFLFGFVKQAQIPDDASPCAEIINHFSAAYPDSPSREMKVGALDVSVIESPIGEYGIFFEEGILWVATNPKAIEVLWGTPPPAPKEDKPPLYMAALEERPDTAFAVFLKTQPGQEGQLPLPGGMSQFLGSLGIAQLNGFFQVNQGAGTLTLEADGNPIPGWVQQWQPVEQFPFTPSDPMGLMELAFHWPGRSADAIAQATGEELDGEEASEENDAGDSEQPSLSPPQRGERQRERGPRGRGGRMVRGDRNMDPQAMRERFERMAMQNPELAERLRNRNEEAPTPLQESVSQFQRVLFTDMMPAGHTVGFNFFGFYNGVPSMAFALPDVDPEGDFLQRVRDSQRVTKEPIEIANLPGMVYDFAGPVNSQPVNFNELLVIERDGITYLFDGKTPARHYLAPESAPEREAALRELVTRVKNPAQVKAVLSEDLFQFLLEQEIEKIPDGLSHKQEIADFLKEFSNHLAPMAVSAGIQENQWFLEGYSPSSKALLADSALLAIAIQGFLGY
jgi:hypothetical protein